MPEEQVRWGILGCAGIAAKVCEAIAESSNAKVVAVASRSKEKSEQFRDDNAKDATAYGSYDELLEDKSVQVVYFPLPTGIRTEWVLKAAAKKKHVLCEKPIANADECRAMVDACDANGVQFMDNTMFMHHERLSSMRDEMNDKDSFGTLRHVNSSFTLPFGLEPGWAENNIRMQRSSEPLGCLGDLGWYNVRISLWAFDYEDPEQVCCNFLEQTSEGVPITATAIIKFSGGRAATFDCSFTQALRQSADIVGSKATLKVPDFVVNSKKAEASFVVEQLGIGNKAVTFCEESVKSKTVEGCVQHTRLIEKFSELVARSEIDSSWPKATLQTQVVLSALEASGQSGGIWTPLKAV